MQPSEIRWRGWAAPLRAAAPLWVVLALVAGLILWFSPAEQTLGQGIKWVYIHVAVIWTAMLCLVTVGILSLAQVFSDRPGWRQWGTAASWSSLGLLALALVTSLIVMQVNWGGITWDEPRMQALLRATAIWVVVHFAGPWITDRRLRGVLVAVVVVVAILPLRAGPLVIHPPDPLGLASSNAFRLAAAGLFGVVLAASTSVVWVIKQRLRA